MHERRKLTRWDMSKPARIKFEGAEAFMKAHVIDINFKGMQICFGLNCTKDTILRFKLALSEDCQLEAEAWIAWHRSVGSHNIYGLYFTRISDSDREKIYQFVFRHSPRQISRQWWKDLHDKKEEGGEKMEDRRIFERIPASFPVKLLDVDNGKEEEASTCDICANGVGVFTDKELALQTPVEVWLRIPDKGEPLYTRGRVAWSKMVKANIYRSGINLEKADLMGLSRVLRAA